MMKVLMARMYFLAFELKYTKTNKFVKMIKYLGNEDHLKRLSLIYMNYGILYKIRSHKMFHAW